MDYHIWIDELHNLRLDNQTDVQCVCETTQNEERHINCILTMLRGMYYDVETSDVPGLALSHALALHLSAGLENPLHAR